MMKKGFWVLIPRIAKKDNSFHTKVRSSFRIVNLTLFLSFRFFLPIIVLFFSFKIYLDGIWGL